MLEKSRNKERCVMECFCPLVSFLLCSQERKGLGDGSLRRTLSRGLLHPSILCLQHNLQGTCLPRWRASPLFVFPLLTSYSPFILFVSSCVHPSLLLFPSLPLSLCFWWTNRQWHRHSVWRQGLPMPATCLGFFALSCILSHDAKETQMIYIQSSSLFYWILLLSCCFGAVSW